ncbi:tetratricopeptide repeat protein [Ureibacillus chungkukjangi]|uniref:Tetratricopeptide repeat protein n=1 Tax=Ureibacillus chungkukjangi TaxID=1202712 RepID=A0A318TU91_9BACL|nr:tetratricopeptide repeat protein [Ureibacillus chungkukjangi]PYF08441.1 tetratricopeptide repeat protein [Ureibacillus chungkukjangi]
MELKLEKAITLRKSGSIKESNAILTALVKECPNEAVINYHCAWSFDLLGEETKAVPYYEKAIQLGLPPEELEGAFIGLGSTYRALGEYEKSKSVFLKAMEAFPANRAIQTFYAMTLYNLNEHSQAVELLLNCLIETTKDANLLDYKKALTFYADKLDQTWE